MQRKKMIARKLNYLWLLKRSCWKERRELEAIQQRKLARLIRHAYDNVPYYHEVFRSRNLMPEDIRCAKDLEKLPVLTRQTVQDRFDDLIAKGTDLARCRIRLTSGSTGSPTRLAFESAADDYGHALDFRSMFENGYSFSKRLLELTDPRHQGHESIVQRLGLYKLDTASVYETNDKILDKILSYDPIFLKGYPSLLRCIAQMDLGCKKLSLEKVYSTSELLTEADRRIISKGFGADVIDLYGSVEFPRVAWECERHEGYHMDIDSVVVEVTENGRQVMKGKGALTLTSLYNFAMPLIRYDVGDMAEMDGHAQCSCGRGLPLLKAIYGRWNDRIVLESGREVPPLILYNSDRIKGVRSFKIIQKRKDLFVVMLVKGPDFNRSTYAGFRQTIKTACKGDKVKVAFSVVDSIPRDRSGKFRAVISEVKA